MFQSYFVKFSNYSTINTHIIPLKFNEIIFILNTIAHQVYDGYIHVYYNTNFITIHQISHKKLNYIFEHYVAIAEKSHVFKEENIMDKTKENLEIIEKVYDYE